MSLYALDNEFWEKHLLLLDRAKFLPLLCVQESVQRCTTAIGNAAQQLEELRVSRLPKLQRVAEQQRLLDFLAEERLNEERSRMTGEDIYARIMANMQKHMIAVRNVTLLCETNVITGLTQRIRRRLRREKHQHQRRQCPQNSSEDSPQPGAATTRLGDANSSFDASNQGPVLFHAGAAGDAFAAYRKVQRLVAIAQELETHCRVASVASVASDTKDTNNTSDTSSSVSSAVNNSATHELLDLATIRHMSATLVLEGILSPIVALEEDVDTQSMVQGIFLAAITSILRTVPHVLENVSCKFGRSNGTESPPLRHGWSTQLLHWLLNTRASILSGSPQQLLQMTPSVQMEACTQRLHLLRILLECEPQITCNTAVWSQLVQLLVAQTQIVRQLTQTSDICTTQDIVASFICAVFDLASCVLVGVIGYEVDRQQAGVKTQQLLCKLDWSPILRSMHVHCYNAYVQVSFLRLLVAKCRAEEAACCESKIRIAFWSMSALDDYQPESDAPPPSYQLTQFKQAVHDVTIVSKAVLRAMATHTDSGVVQWHGLMALRYILTPALTHEHSLRVRVGVIVAEDLLSVDESAEYEPPPQRDGTHAVERPRYNHDDDDDDDNINGDDSTLGEGTLKSITTPAAQSASVRGKPAQSPRRPSGMVSWLVDPSTADQLVDYPEDMQPVRCSMQQQLVHVVAKHMQKPELLEQWVLTTYAMSRRTRVVLLWLASASMEAMTSRALLLHDKDNYMTALVQILTEATKRR